MTDQEMRMRQLLHDLAPEPPAVIRASDIVVDHARSPGLDDAELDQHVHSERRSQPPRGQRWAPLAAAAAVAAIAIGIAVAVVGHGRTHSSVAGPKTVAATPTRHPATKSSAPSSSSTSSSGGGGVACAAGQLMTSVTRRGSIASAPYLVIALRNTSTQRCGVSGYPDLAAYTAGSKVPLRLTVSHGTYEIPDAGATHLDLAPSSSAWFAVGTNTGIDGGKNAVTIRSLTIRHKDGSVSRIAVKGGIGAVHDPSGVPVGVTAYAAGTGSN